MMVQPNRIRRSGLFAVATSAVLFVFSCGRGEEERWRKVIRDAGIKAE